MRMSARLRLAPNSPLSSEPPRIMSCLLTGRNLSHVWGRSDAAKDILPFPRIFRTTYSYKKPVAKVKRAFIPYFSYPFTVRRRLFCESRRRRTLLLLNVSPDTPASQKERCGTSAYGRVVRVKNHPNRRRNRLSRAAGDLTSRNVPVQSGALVSAAQGGLIPSELAEAFSAIRDITPVE